MVRTRDDSLSMEPEAKAFTHSIRHPNIVSAIGYSREDPTDAFIVDSSSCRYPNPLRQNHLTTDNTSELY